MNRALILSTLVAAFMLVACDKPPGSGSAPSGQSGTSSMGTPASPASAASN